MNAQRPEPLDIVAAVAELVAGLGATRRSSEWHAADIRAAGDYVEAALRLLVDDAPPVTVAVLVKARELAAVRAQRTEAGGSTATTPPSCPVCCTWPCICRKEITALRLLRHDRSGRETVTTVAEGHPPIPDVLEVLRAVVAGIGYRPVSDVSWWHRSHTPWDAVVGLHCRGEHDDATALVRLLAWCDAQSPDMADPIVWEITTPEPVAVPVAPHTGAATTPNGGAV